MPYVAEKPANTPPLDEVRARVPGWGVDLDYKDRPAVPMEQLDPGATGAHWHFPERQPEKWARERSIEHKFLTPVFGTSCPPRGISGALRKFAYTYSEGRTAHWLILLAADRVDVVEGAVEAALAGKPDNLLAETGVIAEFTRHGVRSRVGKHRTDWKHQWMDPLIVAGPWLLAGYAAYRAGRAVAGLAAGRDDDDHEPIPRAQPRARARRVTYADDGPRRKPYPA